MTGKAALVTSRHTAVHDSQSAPPPWREEARRSIPLAVRRKKPVSYGVVTLVEPAESRSHGEADRPETSRDRPVGEHWLAGWAPDKPRRAAKVPATILQKSKSKCRMGLTRNPWRPLTDDGCPLICPPGVCRKD